MANIAGSQLVVVTGGAGFIGSQLALALLEAGLEKHRLFLVDDPEAFIVRSCCQELKPLTIPIQSPDDFLLHLSKGLKIDAFFHMGASSSTEEMRVDYLNKVNVEFSKILWDHSTENKIPFFYASSAATYGNGEFGFSDDPKLFAQLKPLNPYGQSKLDFDLYVKQCSELGKAPPKWAGFRFFNVYGAGEEHKGSQASVLWTALKQIRGNGTLKLFKSHNPKYKDGEQQRDFIWVGDLTKTLINFATNTYKNGIYNLGTGQARTFLDLAKAVSSALDIEARIDFIPTPEQLRAHYQYFTQADLTRLRASGYDFKPTPLETGIAKSIEKILKHTEFT